MRGRNKLLNCYYENTLLSYCNQSNTYEIDYNGMKWISNGRKPYVIIRHKIKNKYIYVYRPFNSAKKTISQIENNKIVVSYSGFSVFGKRLPFELVCSAEITHENEIVFSLQANNETDMDIHAVYFPGPFEEKIKGKKSYAIDTMRQGMIIPDGYKKNQLSTFLLTKYWRKINTGDCYMPFWGRVCDKKGFIAIVDTPYDAEMFSCFGKNKSFLNSVNWRSSLGKLSYERKIIFRFFNKCDYNTIAKEFRNYLIENDSFVTIDEKIKKNPKVSNLIGTPVLHHGIFETIHPKSRYYKKGESNQKLHAKFEERAVQLKKIKENGLENLYIHTDGWGVNGYDNKHPYVFPPSKEAGGYKGMKRLSDECKKLGYIFGIHDQYRDYYFDCVKYDESLAVQNIDGTNPYCDIWYGGPHTWLCSGSALKFLKDTVETFEKNNIEISGAYLDVFSVMWGDECFHKEHKITREQSIDHRRECFDYLRKKGIIVSSEEPASLMINEMDLVHHAPYAVRPQERGVAVGISVPLTNLVYHDCVFVPWIVNGVGGWGIPDGQQGKLHCILNAQTPYFSPFIDNKELLSDSLLKEEIILVKEIAGINKKLFNKEMISHCFLDNSLNRQKTTYSDGTVITVDFNKEIYQIN